METHRFYQKELPEVGECIMVKILEVNEVFALAELLEYNNITGYIPLQELSRRRIRSISKLTRIGICEVVVVTACDYNKKYIDLSKNNITKEEHDECMDRVAKHKIIHTIFNQLKSDVYTLPKLYELISWPLEEEYESCHNGLMEFMKDTSILDIDNELKDNLITHLKKYNKSRKVKVRTVVNVQCFSKYGVDGLKEGLKEGLTVSTDDHKVKINLIKSPHYTITIDCLDTETDVCLSMLEKAINLIHDKIKTLGGSCTMEDKPSIVGLDLN